MKIRHYFVLNPVAGSGDRRVINKFLAELKASDLDYEIHRTLGKAETINYVKKSAETAKSQGIKPRFYACGGDGTLNDVVCGLINQKDAEISVIPCGTGNDFVRSFTNHKGFLSLEKQLDCTQLSCDVLKINDSYAINAANLGLDSDIADRAGELRRSMYKGSMAYIKAITELVPGRKPFKLTYTVNGITEVEDEVLLCAIGNAHYYGGGFNSCPNARIDDGLMDVVMIRPLYGLTLAKLLYMYHQGTFLNSKEADKFVKYFKCDKIELVASEEKKLCRDGEAQLVTSINAEVIPSSITLALPSGCEFKS